jgi:hypothetical protein
MTRIFLTALCALTITFSGVARSSIIESGDLNFISDVGNPSDGLAFLDMTFSDGLTQAAALANAQLTHADARLATPTEFTNLFLATGLTFLPGTEPSVAFNNGSNFTVTLADPGVATLQAALGSTTGSDTYVWSDPDGSLVTSTTRDILTINADGLTTASQFSSTPATAGIGWLLVSDAAELSPVEFDGIPTAALGAASLAVVNDVLIVSNIGSSGNDGVSIAWPDGAPGVAVTWSPGIEFRIGTDAGAELTSTRIGIVNDVPDSTLSVLSRRVMSDRLEMSVDYSGISSVTQTVTIRNAGTVVLTRTIANLQVIDVTPEPAALEGGSPSAFFGGDPIPGIDIHLEQLVIRKKFTASLTFTVDGMTVVGDEIEFEHGPIAPVQLITSIEITATNPGGTNLAQLPIGGIAETVAVPIASDIVRSVLIAVLVLSGGMLLFSRKGIRS